MRQFCLLSILTLIIKLRSNDNDINFFLLFKIRFTKSLSKSQKITKFPIIVLSVIKNCPQNCTFCKTKHKKPITYKENYFCPPNERERSQKATKTADEIHTTLVE